MDDTAIGDNIARLRGEMSQAALAEKMKAKGWKWSQSTVWSVEKGDRPLRLREASDLATILGVVLDDLLRQPADLDLEQHIQENIAALREVYADVADGVEVLLLLQDALDELQAPYPDEPSTSDSLARVQHDARREMDQHSVASAVKTGAWQYARKSFTEQEAARVVAEAGGLSQFAQRVTGCQVKDD